MSLDGIEGLGLEGPGLQAWAADGQPEPEERVHELEAGDRSGTLRHALQTHVPREQYLAMIKGAGIPARTHTAPIALVNISDLVGIQETINEERLGQHLADPRLYAHGTRSPGHGALIDRPIVVRVGGRMFCHDGHHRVTAASLRGADSVKVRYIDLDAEGWGA